MLRATPLGNLEAVTMRWWLTPYWSKEMSTRYSMFNAKAETLGDSTAFKEPLVRRRCVVPMAGFYEWAKQDEAQIAVLHPPAGGRRHVARGLVGSLAEWQRNAREFYDRDDGGASIDLRSSTNASPRC